jgi:PAS domain S-box-containing protein
MGMGAADVVADNEPQHLVLVVKRELEHVCANLRLKQTMRMLEEAEQRCRLLLEGSKAAIAYVHEGMHIYANDVYLKLFGFTDADELLGLPLIDLLDSSSAEALKRVLKKFRQDEEETEFDFSGTNTEGTEVSGSMTLASAEYEGEHCLQVTVRTLVEADEKSAQRNGVNIPAGSTPISEDDIPVLTDSASVGEAKVEPAADDNAETFHLELEDPATTTADAPIDAEVPTLETDTDAAEESEAAAEAAEQEAQPQPREESPSPAQPATANGNHAAGSLADFLAASESCIGNLDDQGFCAVFVAQVDAYPDLQQEYGLSGAEKVCAEVQKALIASATTPNMPLSSFQWAVTVVADDREQALLIVDDYRETVEKLLLEVKQKTVRPTATFGGARVDMEGCDSLTTAIETTLDSAFSTMQSAASDFDGNHIELPQPVTAAEAMDDEANRILTLINEAIENQKFVLLFQPIISLRGDSDEHYEVFLRMLDRDGSQLAPNEFLRTAIDNGVAGKIDRWVILQSIKMLSTHRSKGNNTRLTINVTSNSVADPEFIQWLAVAIKAARLPSDAVIFQITERDASTYIRQTREFVEGLKKMHCRSSLSRFGLSTEPFETLRHIPSDFVKLDGSYIEAMADDPELKAEVTSMIQKLQGGGKLTIVPMVESANVLSALWQAGANYIQGHYLQQPSTSMDYDFSTDD